MLPRCDASKCAISLNFALSAAEKPMKREKKIQTIRIEIQSATTILIYKIKSILFYIKKLKFEMFRIWFYFVGFISISKPSLWHFVHMECNKLLYLLTFIVCPILISMIMFGNVFDHLTAVECLRIAFSSAIQFDALCAHPIGCTPCRMMLDQFILIVDEFVSPFFR